MSTTGILPPSPTAFPTTGPGSGPGEFLDLSLFFPDEDSLGLTALSSNTNTSLWNSELTQSQAESDWVEQRPINVQVRNGQPTPPPSLLEEKYLNNLVNNAHNFPAAGARPKPKPRRSQGGNARREKSLERNRIAASKCRQKKREQAAHLESCFKAQWQKKVQLESELSNLRCQVLSLKNEVLKHAHCGDGRVGEHLSQMMQQIMTHHAMPEPKNKEHAEGMSPPPHLFPPQLEFDLEEAMSDFLELEMRRESKTSHSSEVSLALSMDENFDDLINV